MKVLFVVKSLNSVGGGAERVLADVTSGLVDRGYYVSILTYDAPNAGSFYPLNKSINRIDIGIGRPNSRSTIKETLKRILALRRTILPIRPDVVWSVSCIVCSYPLGWLF